DDGALAALRVEDFVQESTVAVINFCRLGQWRAAELVSGGETRGVININADGSKNTDCAQNKNESETADCQACVWTGNAGWRLYNFCSICDWLVHCNQSIALIFTPCLLRTSNNSNDFAKKKVLSSLPVNYFIIST